MMLVLQKNKVELIDVFYFMGQSTSDVMQVRSLLTQNWLPSDKQSNVFVHRSTHEQVHRHFIRILAKDLPRETALFSTRMNNHQPYICRLLYFHLASDSRAAQDHQKEFREMLVYTDRFLQLRQWNKEKMIFALHGLRRLISVHGPIKISQQMLGQNQYGQVKVWISENPANNHPDSKYMSEEQSMADFAALLTQKNQQLANLLLGCLTLKEAFERINRCHKEESLSQQTHSHRAIGGQEAAKKKETADRTVVTPYKNVFGQFSDGTKSKHELLTPKANAKNFEHYPQSSFLSKDDEFSIQATSSITLGRYRDFPHLSKYAQNQDAMICKSRSRANNQTMLDAVKSADSSTRPNMAENNLQFNKKCGSNIKNQQTPKTFTYQPRFQTANISSPLGNYPTLKGKAETTWVSNSESVNLYSTASYYNRREAKSGNNFKEGTKNGQGITIINNNINNYYNSITHNHILKAQKTHQDQFHQFRTQSQKEETPNNLNAHASNQFFKTAIKGKEKYSIPNFLQQKKKPSSQWIEEPPSYVGKCKSNTNLVKNGHILSNPQSPCESPQVASNNHNQDEHVKNSQKVLNFTKNDQMMNNHKSSTPTFSFSNALHPRTPPPMSPQTFSSFQKGFSNFQFRVPLRTKTTQFYQKNKEGVKKDQIQNKSFTQHQLQKSIYEQKQAEGQERKEPVLKQKQIETNSNFPQQPAQEPKPQEQGGRLQFKKQLRNEFKFLLGGGGTQARQKQEQSTRTTLNSKADEGQGKQGNLKDKIIRKQIVFAELKKEALKVLTDD